MKMKDFPEFTLVRKSKPEEGPVPLVAVDDELVREFKGLPLKHLWFRNWIERVGGILQGGTSLGEQIIYCKGLQEKHPSRLLKEHLEVLEYLDQHFVGGKLE